MPKSKLKIVEAFFGNLFYAIWCVRNEAVWHKKVASVRRVVETIKTDSELTLSHFACNKTIHAWIRSLWTLPTNGKPP